MDTYEEVKERAYFDYLEAREKALDAATGHFVASNVPDEHLRIISDSTTDQTIGLAARLALHRRGIEHDRRTSWE